MACCAVAHKTRVGMKIHNQQNILLLAFVVRGWQIDSFSIMMPTTAPSAVSLVPRGEIRCVGMCIHRYIESTPTALPQRSIRYQY
jgi:hypothetical protein